MASKYDSLTEWLQNCGQDSVRFTFAELQRIITIPPSALRDRPSWANCTSASATQFQKGWMNAGYVVSEIRLSEEYVVFTRNTATPSHVHHSVPSRREPTCVEEELKLTIPANLTELTADRFFMVALTKHNSEIVENCIANDPQYRSRAESMMHHYFDNGDFSAEAYFAIINRIAIENSTRTPESSMRQLADYCAEPNNRFLEQLQSGVPGLVDTLTGFLTDNGSRKDKSLCSKLCRYLNAWYFGGCAYTINDSVVRAILPYYLAFYHVDRTLWQGKNFDDLSYAEFYTIFTALRACVPELNNHELDHLIWYAYKNDTIRSEVAKALATVIR